MTFLRKLFAPREQVWKPHCDGIGGRYVEGGFWKGDRVEIPHRDWTLTLRADTGGGESRLVSTRLSAEAESAGAGEFMLWLARGWPGQKALHLAARLPGAGIREADVPGLADRCLALTSDVERAKIVFGSPELQALVNDQPELLLLINGTSRCSRPGRVGVSVAAPGVLEDAVRLKPLVALSRQLLDALSESGIVRPAEAG